LHSAPHAVWLPVWALFYPTGAGPWLQGKRKAARRRAEESHCGTERPHVGAQSRHVPSFAVSRPTPAAPGEERQHGRDVGQVGKKATSQPSCDGEATSAQGNVFFPFASNDRVIRGCFASNTRSPREGRSEPRLRSGRSRKRPPDGRTEKEQLDSPRQVAWRPPIGRPL